MGWDFCSLPTKQLVGQRKIIQNLELATTTNKDMCTANVFRGFQGLYREIGVRGFQIYGACMLPAIPVILKSPYSDFHCNI